MNGTRETALLDPVCTVEHVHAVILSRSSASWQIETSNGGIIVSALAAGDVVDPESGWILAGTRRPDGGFADSTLLVENRLGQISADTTRSNTVQAAVGLRGVHAVRVLAGTDNA